MIKSIKHKGLRLFFEKGKTNGIRHEHIKRLQSRLFRLNTAKKIEEIALSSYRLHPLEGNKKGRWSIWVDERWRLTFEFDPLNGDVHVLDYEDYH